MTTLSIPEAAALMKIHPETVKVYIRRGILPAAKIGRAYVLLEDDVSAFIKKQIKNQTEDRIELLALSPEPIGQIAAA